MTSRAFICTTCVVRTSPQIVTAMDRLTIFYMKWERFKKMQKVGGNSHVQEAELSSKSGCIEPTSTAGPNKSG